MILQENFKLRLRENREEGGSNTSKGINAQFLDCDFNVNPGLTSAQLLATIEQHVSSTLDLGQECALETYSPTASSSWQ